MCAILGGTNTTWKYEEGIYAMGHRGPDSALVDRVDSVTMAFARLSIIDLSEEAMQPMHSADDNVIITFNGEIYDYQKIRQELIANGCVFRTTSDSEVILNGYVEYGVDGLLDRIDGMFAIAIYDKRIKKIFLIRDRVGIKPLFYYFDGREFAFASELKGITKLIDRELEVDNTAIYDYLTYQYIPRPKTLYKKIFKQEPGTIIEYDLEDNAINTKVYWELSPSEFQESVVDDSISLKEKCRELISKNVNTQLIADVPTGVFLSGGIDSTVITKTAKECKPDIHSFSIDFTRRRLSERPYIDLAIDSVGIEGHIFQVKNQDVKDRYDEIAKWFDEPFADIGAYPSYLLAQNSRKYVTVALSGDGGDELFAGYPRHFMKLKADSDHAGDKSCIDFDLKQIASTLSSMERDEKLKIKECAGIPEDYDDYWFLRKYYNTDLPPITRLQYLDFMTYLPESVLTKTDRTSMQVSLEVRVPFLNKELIEFVFSLHEEDRCGKGDELKHLLKESYLGVLPDPILYRYKKGFDSPGFEKDPFPQRQLFNEVWRQRIWI